jgi:hypothetical protein
MQIISHVDKDHDLCARTVARILLLIRHVELMHANYVDQVPTKLRLSTVLFKTQIQIFQPQLYNLVKKK